MYLDISQKIVIVLVSPIFKSNQDIREGSQNCSVTLYIRISNKLTVAIKSERAGTSGV